MANHLSTNPWVLDGSSLSTVLVTSDVKVSHFQYARYTSGVSSNVKLADRFGNEVWETTGDTTGDVQRSGKVGWIHGLQELAHTDGVVLVYFE